MSEYEAPSTPKKKKLLKETPKAPKSDHEYEHIEENLGPAGVYPLSLSQGK